MPFFIHPSSCCDVCFETYSCRDHNRAPCVLPCGHVFCKSCVAGLKPYTCPLCRKRFSHPQCHRVHFSEDFFESELLTELSELSWQDSEGKDALAILMGKWLDKEPQCSHSAKARLALTAYQQAREENDELDKAIRMSYISQITELSRELQRQEGISKFERQQMQGLDLLLETNARADTPDLNKDPTPESQHHIFRGSSLLSQLSIRSLRDLGMVAWGEDSGRQDLTK